MRASLGAILIALVATFAKLVHEPENVANITEDISLIRISFGFTVQSAILTVNLRQLRRYPTRLGTHVNRTCAVRPV